MSIAKLARPEIVAMKPYSSARKEAPGEGILLNANEAPWALLDQDSRLNRYPDPQPERLLRRLARLYQASEENLLVTRGSDEGIDLLTRVFCRAGQDAILQCPPAFGMYRIAAQTQGADVVSVPRFSEDFSLDQQGIVDALEADPRIKLVFLTSPSNPTGDVLDREFLLRLLGLAKGRALVIVDEAYAEFTGHPSATALVNEHEHLVVLRTLSKAWAAAGLRCGSVIAQETVISLLRRIIAPYPLPSPVVSLAMEMLDDDILEKQQNLLRQVKGNKRILLAMLEGRAFIRKIFPGEANFVLVEVDDADSMLAFCARHNVILRGFPAEAALRDCIRISVGSEEDLASLGYALDNWEQAR
ncbi:MAG: histidinol-phosphate transaminase [Xanthomonadales bacterium]|jgi:histidinol-phosphate aminotransferase|nr:histidinol-phosphate transaminase [Xanthomonadales bacterium]